MGQPSLWFLYVQLAAYTQYGPWYTAVADLRLAQMSGLSLNHTGMATAVDLGDPDSPIGNIHPRNKSEIARRLDLIAKALIYDDTTTEYQNPRVLSARAVGRTPNLVVELDFDVDTIGGDGTLVFQPAICPVSVEFEISILDCAWFEIQLSDNQWYNASLSLQDVTSWNTNRQVKTLVQLTLTNVEAGLTAKSVRYGYASWPIITLFNRSGLPVLPFVLPTVNSDEWIL